MKISTARQAFSRRNVLNMTGAALAAPFYVRSSYAGSNRELSILFWSDELPRSVLDGFERETGIRVNFSGYGSNEEMMARLQLTDGTGFDIASPSHTRGSVWREANWSQPWDSSSIIADRLSPQGIDLANGWDFDGTGSHWIPHVWGAHGMAWRTDLWQPDALMPSYADIWDEANAGKTMGHARGLYFGTARWMEATGELPVGSLRVSYTSREAFVSIWDHLASFCMPRKGSLRLLWTNADMQRQGFMVDGVVLGQTWDGPPTAMRNEGLPVVYRSPREGAMGWVDGMSLLKSSQNVEGAHAFLEYVTRPEVAGAALNEHGYNTFVRGATKHAGARYRENFMDAYPGDALEKLMFIPERPNWAIELENEYLNRFRAA
jgi:spermidine/putrescine transport system substrate-binding protein